MRFFCSCCAADVFEQGGGGADLVGWVCPAGEFHESLEGDDARSSFLLRKVLVVVVEGGGERVLEGGVAASAVERGD